jgi:sialate O-acetylesterase
MSYTYTHVSPFQVLQRDPITNSVRVIIDNKTIDLPVGGPYTINDCHNVFVGDIWIMAGQSNMRGHGFLKNPFTHQPLHFPSLPHVCLYDSTEHWRKASEPIHQLYASPRAVHHTLPDPTVANPQLLQFRGASLGLAFAKEYQKLNDNVPVGLVACAHGNTSLHDWQRPAEINQETVQTTLYGAMIDKIRAVGNHIAGVLWYQGESDAVSLELSKTYEERFQLWLDLLRSDTRSDLPIAFVQLGTHRIDREEAVKGWRNVQDYQRKLFGYRSITAGVASLDCSLDDRVHLSASGLQTVGRRLARAAIQAMQKKAEVATPICESATYEQVDLISTSVYSIRLSFSQMDDEWDDQKSVQGFEIENCTNDTCIIDAKIEGKDIRLYLSHNPTVTGVMYVKYGMNPQLSPNLVTKRGSALPAFKELAVNNNK